MNALLHHFGPMPGSEAARPGIVHRLDRDTSGVMVIARTTAALEHLGRQFAARTVTKRYLAVVRGRLRPEVLRIAHTHRASHDRAQENVDARTRRSAAVTRVRVLERLRRRDVGGGGTRNGAHAPDSRAPRGARPFDRRRCRLTAARGRSEASWIARQALHAAMLRSSHPDSGATMTFEAELVAWHGRVAHDVAYRSADT